MGFSASQIVKLNQGDAAGTTGFGLLRLFCLLVIMLTNTTTGTLLAQSALDLPSDKSISGASKESPVLPSLSFADSNGRAIDSCTPVPSTRVPLQAYWDYGLKFSTDNEKFNLHLGGVGQLDSVYFFGPSDLFATPSGSANGVGDAQATFLRRAILQAEGRIYDHFDFMIQYDFANAANETAGQQPPSFGNIAGEPTPLNLWLQVRDVPILGNVRIGNQVKTIGMDNNTSGANLPFMERSDNMDAFYGPFDNGFSVGITAQHWNESERITWRYGIFQPETDVFGVALNHYVLGARVTALPLYEEQGERLIHLGLGYWGGEIVQDQWRVRVRPVLRNGPGYAVPILADTGEVPGSREYTIAPEFAMVAGSFTLQAEYAANFLTQAIDSNGQNQGTVFFHGGYVEALYFLTGEHQNYDRKEGSFGRVIPKQDYLSEQGGCSGGCGAWQVGVRFSFVDLNDKTIQGGQLEDWTFGLNWFLNPNMKIQFNYLVEYRDTPGVPAGWIQGLGIRAGFDF